MPVTPIYERGVNQVFREYLRQRFERDLGERVVQRMTVGEGTGQPTGITPDTNRR